LLPDVIFGVVGGVLADMFDRRLLLMAVQTFMAVTAVALTVLTFAGQMPPALLLTFTFVLGSGSVISLPAYQSLIPNLVPRNQIAAASTLGSISVNVARAIGPAIAGVLIARIGVGAVFAINAAAFLFYAIVVAAWHPNAQAPSQLPERFVSALRAGGRYVRYAPVHPAHAPSHRAVPRARQRALGTPAIGGDAAPAHERQRLWPAPRRARGWRGRGVVSPGSAADETDSEPPAGGVEPRVRSRDVIVVLVPNIIVAVLVLLPAGFAWMAVLSTMNASVQLFLPEWVRARGLSVYLTVLFGSQAIGAVLWGVIAAPKGVVPAFLIAAALMVVGAATTRICRSSIPWAWTGKPSRDPSRSSLCPPSPTRDRSSSGSLHDLAGARSCIPGGDGSRSPLPASHRRDAMGSLPRW